MDDSSAVIDFSTVLIQIALIVDRAKEPRPFADRVVPAGSGVVSEGRERVVALATIIMMGGVVSLVVSLVMRIVVGVIHAKEVADAIADGGCALASMVVLRRPVGVRLSMSMGVVRVMRVGRRGGLGVELGKVMGRVRTLVVRRVGAMMMGSAVARVLEMYEMPVMNREMEETYGVCIDCWCWVCGVLVVVVFVVSRSAPAPAARTKRRRSVIGRG